MSKEEIIDLIYEIEPDNEGNGYIDCSNVSDYADHGQYKRIVAAIKQNIELQKENQELQEKNEELNKKLENLEKRLRHLCESEVISNYDTVDYITNNYMLDINEVDSFFKTGNRLIFDYANKNKLNRIDDFRIETKGDKHRILYDPIKVTPTTLELNIIESTNTGKCPLCKKELGKYTAISRKDNKTEICSHCGIFEAIEMFIKANKDKKE